MALPVIAFAFTFAGAMLAGASLIAAVILGGLAALSVLFTPKPPTFKMKPASLSDFAITQANEGQPVPIVFGTVKLPGNIIFYENLEVVEVKQKVKGGKGGGGSKEQTTGYKYYIDLWQGICLGKVQLIKVIVQEKETLDTSRYSYSIWNDGTMNTYPTTANAPQLTFASKIPGVAHIFYKRFYVGENTTVVPTLTFWVKRILSTGLPAENMTTGNNPAAIVYDLLVNVGKINPVHLNMQSFLDASQYYNQQSWGLNLVISSTTDLKEECDKILGMVDSYLTYDEEGRISIKILKKTDTSEGTIQNDFISFSMSKPSVLELYNDFKANFLDDKLTVRTIEMQNPALISFVEGRRKIMNLDLTAFRRMDIITSRLTEFMKQYGYPKTILSLTLPLKYSFYKVGSVITIKNTELKINGDFRVYKITEPKLDSNEFQMELVQFSEKIFDNRYIEPTITIIPPFECKAKKFTRIRVFELDYNSYFKDAPAYLVMVSKEVGFEEGIAVFMSTTGADYSHIANIHTYAVAGNLTSAYSSDTFDIDDSVGFTFKPYKTFTTFDSIARKDFFVENRVCLIGNELMAFQNYNPFGAEDMRVTGIIRGIHWTPKSSHAINDSVFLSAIHDNVLQINVTSSFYLKLCPIQNGEAVGLSEATAILVTPSMKARKPYGIHRLLATRAGSTVTVDVFAVTKERLTGAGKANPDIYTDVYPFDVEGFFKYKIGTEAEVQVNNPHFVINRSGAFTLTVWHIVNGFVSSAKTLSVGSDDGNYVS